MHAIGAGPLSAPRTVVLVGGGHTHVQVLRRWAMDPPANIRLQVVLDRPVAVYSGMVPGFVAGDYALHELEIDVLPLARRAKAGVILSAAIGLDPVRREISIEGRPPIRFDLASIDVGSTVRGLGLPGVSKHTLATRPIGRFVLDLDKRLDAFEKLDRPPRILLVGGGAAGTELALTLDARLRQAGIRPSIAIITGDDAIGAVHAKEGVVAVMGMSIRTETRRDPAYGGGEDEVFMTDEYAFGERAASDGGYGQDSKATAPTAQWSE